MPLIDYLCTETVKDVGVNFSICYLSQDSDVTSINDGAINVNLRQTNK